MNTDLSGDPERDAKFCESFLEAARDQGVRPLYERWYLIRAQQKPVGKRPHRLPTRFTTADPAPSLTPRQRAIVLDAVDEQLVHQAAIETRNRKPMRPNLMAPWELRLGGLRVTMTSRKHLNKWFSFAQLGSRKVTASELPVR